MTSLVNVRYLTGFTGSNAALLVTPEGVLLATDGRYTTQAAAQAPDVELVTDRECALALGARAAKDGIRRLAFEEHQVTVETHGRLADVAGKTELVPLGHAVERLRQVKDEEEIACIREACAISDRALGEMLESILLGRAERHIAQELERRMMDHGAEAIGFDTIVASGPNSAVPHHRPGDRRVDEGDFLKIGARPRRGLPRRGRGRTVRHRRRGVRGSVPARARARGRPGDPRGPAAGVRQGR